MPVSTSPASTAGSASPASPPFGAPSSSSLSTALQPSSTLLREHQEEFERLRMGSFNQALRINFLEERLLRYKNGTAFESEDLENELFQLRLALQDREQELKRKSLTIVRATEYMKELQDQLRGAGAELERLRTAPQPRNRHHDSDSDSTNAAQLRVELQHALEREQQLTKRVTDLEDELASHEDTVASVTAKHHELLTTHAASERAWQQQADAAHAVVTSELEQTRRRLSERDADVARLEDQLATLTREKALAETRHQSKLTRMDEQVQAQLEQLKRESATYRSEHTQLVTERARSELAADAAKQETGRLQAEVERLATALETATRDADVLRLQTVKLTATCAHKTETLDAYKLEREQTMQNLQKAEDQVQHWRSVCEDRDVRLKSAERRAVAAEDEAARVTAQRQQSTNERVQSLESERLATLQETARLRSELGTLQHEYETLTAQFEAVETELAEAKTRIRELAAQCAASEQELALRTQQLDESEQRVMIAASSEAESRDEQVAQLERLAAEKRELLQALHEEQEHADAMERNAGEIERANAVLVAQLEAVARELCGVTGRDVLARGTTSDVYESVVPQLREAIQHVEKYVRVYGLACWVCVTQLTDGRAWLALGTLRRRLQRWSGRGDTTRSVWRQSWSS